MEATRAWHRLLAGMTGDDPVPPKPVVSRPSADTGGLTVKAVADAFLADAHKRCKPESMAVYKSALNRFAKKFGNRPAEGLRPHEAEAFADRPDWSPSTKNTFLSSIVTAFRWAARAGLLDKNPMTGVRKPPCGSRGASAAITQEQFDKLCSVAPPAFRLFLTGLWLTGCRPGELAALKASDVDFETGAAILADHKTVRKTGKPRFIYLSSEAVKLFKAQAALNKTGPLFQNSWGNAWNRFTLQKAMVAARARAGLSDAVVCYGLRHSYATAALLAGIPDATVAALLGHSGTTMLHRHYSHLTAQAQAMREAAKKVR